MLFALVFFTLSHSKLVTYLLPTFPMLAWAAAEAWSDPARERRGAWGLAIVYAVVAIALAIAGWGNVLARVRPPIDPAAATAARVLAGCFAYIVLRSALAARGRAGNAFPGALLFTPALLLALGGTLFRYASGTSGGPLAEAILARAPLATVRYEGCYSPGTDFLLARPSILVSESGRETTSEYQARYRTALIARGQWLPLAAAAESSAHGMVIVRPANTAGFAPLGAQEFFRDGRFVAYRMDAAKP